MRFVVTSNSIRAAAISAVVEGTEGDKTMEVIVRPYRKSRSREQNDLFHALMRDLSKGYAEVHDVVVAPDVWKEFMKRHFLGQDSVTMKDGSEFTYTRHTSDLKTKEMSEFIENVVAYSAKELGVVLRLPDDHPAFM